MNDKNITITKGALIRAWDFEPMEGRKDRFVEGVVLAIENDTFHIHVTKDTAFKIGSRLIVHAPIQGRAFGDDRFDRIELIDENLMDEVTS